MNEFAALQAKAREGRDRAIKLARSEYRQTIKRIGELKAKLSTPRKRHNRNAGKFIEAAIPEDREFTRADILKTLRTSHPGIAWSSETVKRHLTRMQARGQIRKLRTLWKSGPAVYVLNGMASKPPATPLGDAIAALLKERPMTDMELAVALIELGRENRKTALRHVREELRRDCQRFKREGEKWAVL